MKTRKILAAVLAAAIVLPAMQSCKKGAEDPGLSLRSRKARVVGDWTVQSFDKNSTSVSNYDDDPNNDGDVVKVERTSTESWDGSTYSKTETNTTTYDGNGSPDKQTNETTINGTSITEKTVSEDDGTTTTTTKTGTYSFSGDYKYSFKKDGTVEITIAETKSSTFDETQTGYKRKTTNTETVNWTYTGTWAFLGKSKADEMKNKQRIAIWYQGNTGSSSNEINIDYTDTDSNDFIDYNNSDYSSKSTDTPTTWEKNSTQPDEVWEIVMLKNKEMKVVGKYSMTSKGTQTSEVTQYDWGSNSTTTTSTTTNYDYTQDTNVTMTLVQ